MKQTETIGGRECTLYTTEGAQILLLQPVDAHDQSLLDSEVETIGGLTDVPFTLVAFAIRFSESTKWLPAFHSSVAVTPCAASSSCWRRMASSTCAITGFLVCDSLSPRLRYTALPFISRPSI